MWELRPFVLRASRSKGSEKTHVVNELQRAGQEKGQTERRTLDRCAREDWSGGLAESAYQAGKGHSTGTLSGWDDGHDVGLSGRDIHLGQAEACKEQPDGPGE